MTSVATTLGSVCAITMGQAPDGASYNKEGRGLPLIAGAGDFVGDKPQAKKHTTAPGKVCHAGDIVLGIRASIGAKVLADTDYCLGRGVAGLRPGRSLDVRYLWHWLTWNSSTLAAKGRGATFLQVNRQDIVELPLNLPPLEVQRRIAAILDQADILCASARMTVDLLNEAEVALFQGTFACTPGSETWMTASLSEVVKPGTVVTYGIVQAGDECPGGVPYIRTGDIQDGVILKGQLRHTAPEIAARFARSKVEPGDIVMSIRATVGTTAVVPLSLEGANLTQGTARIATGGLVDGVFLLHYLRSAEAQRWIQSQVKGATFREITLERLRMLPVPIPPRGLQERFGRTVAMVEQVTSRQSSLVAGLRELFAALRDRAVKGEL